MYGCSSCPASGVPEYGYEGNLYTFSGVLHFKGSEHPRISPWKAVFDALSGSLVSYVLGEKELIEVPLVPCFARAATENDLGARLDARQDLWRSAEFKVASFNVEKPEFRYRVNV